MMLTVNKKKLCDNELVHAGFRLCEEINRYGYEAYLVGVNAKNEVIRALPKPFQGYTFDEVKKATLTVKDVWEANKDFASQKALFQLPNPMQTLDGTSWNFIAYVHATGENVPKIVPIFALFNPETNETIYSVTPKLMGILARK